MTDIVSDFKDGVFILGFNRPERKNAITAQMYRDIATAMRQAQARSDVRAVLLHGSEEVFTSGNDIKDFSARKDGDGDGENGCVALSEKVLAVR